MSEQLDHYQSKTPKGGRTETLPWSLWFNGKPHRLTIGQDTKCKTLDNLENMIRKTAKKKQIKVSVFQEPEQNALVVHAKLTKKSLPRAKKG